MPEPWTGVALISDERQRLRIVDDDQVGTQVHAYGVLQHDGFINFFFEVGEIHIRALQGIVDFFRTLKKSGLPWINRQSARMPKLRARRVSEENSSATPPP